MKTKSSFLQCYFFFVLINSNNVPMLVYIACIQRQIDVFIIKLKSEDLK